LAADDEAVMENPYLQSHMAVAAGPFLGVAMIFSENRFPLFRIMP
jgi:hypothetical protein